MGIVQKFQDEDLELFEAIKEHQNGNKDKSTYIYESTKKYAYKVVHQEVARFKSQNILTGDENSITEDVMQELYIEFFNKIEKFRNEDPRSIFKWISVVSHRMLLDYVDKNKMEVLQFEKDEDFRENNDIWDSSEINDSDMASDHELLPEAALEDKEFQQLILDFIRSLPEAQAQTVLLHFRGGMKYQEIADEMGVSLITVKTRMKKAKDSLEESITKYEKKTGTKLHSVSILPLLWLLYRMAAEETVVPATVDMAVRGALARAYGTGIGVATTSAAKAIGTKILVSIVSATVVIGSAVVGSQLLDKKQETTVEQGDSEDEELDNSTDNKQDSEGGNGISSTGDEGTSDTGNDESAGSDTDNQTQDESNGSDTNNTGSDDNVTQGNTGVGENANGTDGNTGAGENANGTDGNTGAGENTNGTDDNTNNSGNDSSSEDVSNGDDSSESTAAKGTKENPYRIGEKITITDDIVYNPSRYDSQEVYQFEITVTDYIPLEEALAKKGVEFSSNIVLRIVEATVKFTGGTTEGLPYEHTPIDLKLLKENGYSYSWSSFMYGADNSCLYAIQNDVEYDIGLNCSYDTEDEVWSYLGIDYYTSDGQWHRVYVKLE